MKLIKKIKKGTVSTKQINPHWLTILGVVLFALKVSGISIVSSWSWWIVLLPFYIGWCIILGIISILAIGWLMAVIILITVKLCE